MPDLSRARWRKSTKSQDNGGCIEVADLQQAMAVRDSKDPAGPALIFGRQQWSGFVARASAEKFVCASDRPQASRPL
ncbi:DUF397 domain-containing protein [Micromonospora sp. NPDC050397]|uniref:DUF397 domain-containing protein n=1 Tax=Micromonospora sp. NPDC050397 TaxID=3364279 RepID=UPI00384BC9C0